VRAPSKKMSSLSLHTGKLVSDVFQIRPEIVEPELPFSSDAPLTMTKKGLEQAEARVT